MKKKYLICINNEGYSTSIEKRKLYERVEDSESEKFNLVRIIDESGEDYLYPGNYFLGIKLNKEIEEAVESTFS